MDTATAKVVLADDDGIIRELYGRHLREAGYSVVLARDGEEAVELVQREKPQIIVMDIHMPATTGLTALRRLQSEEATKAIPVIMITSAADHRACAEFAQAYNATAFLTKPFSPKQLLVEIQKALKPAAAPAN
jgi:CheY-like chemotaxis protein